MVRRGATHTNPGRTNKSFGDIAVEAFRAGHDLLLFSHIETENKRRGRFGRFRVQDYEEVLSKLRAYIRGSSGSERRFRESLRRILLAKARTLKLWGQSVQKLATKQWAPPSPMEENFVSPSFLASRKYDSGRKLIEKAFEESYTAISLVDGFDLEKMLLSESTMFFLSPDVIDEFSRSIHSQASGVAFAVMPAAMNRPEMEAVGEALEAAVEQYEYVVVSVSTIDHANLLHRTLLHSQRNVRKMKLKGGLVGLVHITPTVLHPDLLGNVNIISNYSRHQLALRTDIDLVLGYVQVNDRRHTPVHLGKNRIFFDVDMSAKHFISAPDAPEFLAPRPVITSKERDLKLEIEELKKTLSTEKKQRLYYQSRVTQIRDLAVDAIRWSGLCIALIGIFGAVQFMWRSIVTIEIQSQDKWWQTTLRWFIHAVNARWWRLVIVSFSLVLIVTGSALFLDVKADDVYASVQKRVLKYLDAKG